MTNAHKHPTCSQNMHPGFTPGAYHNLDPTQTIPTKILANRVKDPYRS
jgi:hypothetical protein